MNTFATVIDVVWLLGIISNMVATPYLIRKDDRLLLQFDFNPVMMCLLLAVTIVFWPASMVVNITMMIIDKNRK